MVGCRYADIGKMVAVHDAVDGKQLANFKLARKPDETVVKHVLDR
jgi:hypothetical protein